MAVTATLLNSNTDGARKKATFSVLLDSSYSIGGEALSAATLGFSAIDSVDTFPARSPLATDLALVTAWDLAASKLVCFQGDSDGVADSPLVEVPDTTNLAAYTAIITVHGV